MVLATSANKLELLQIVDAVAREKLIDKDIVFEALEESIEKAAKARYGMENEISAEIDRKSGETRLFRVIHVVDEVEDNATQMTVADAKHQKPDAAVGDVLTDPLPPIDYGRIAAVAAKQVIFQKVRDAERDRQYDEFKDRVGEIIVGVVKRVEYGHVIVDLGRAEGVIRRDQVIPRENHRQNDRVRCYILDVRREQRGPQIFLSRNAPEFLAHLFKQEVPEIYDGIIEIKSVARDPGSRAKFAVISNDTSIDPVGACVGMRGSRVQAVVSELHGEKIDIINWSPDPANFIVNALAPAEVAKVVLDEDNDRIEVVVPDDQLSLAIGRRGQNVRLASELSGWTIDILTEAQESDRRQEEFVARSQMFVAELDVDETLAQLLVAEGFTQLEEVAFVEIEELLAVEGFDEELAAELQTRANEALERQAQAADERRKELGVEDAVADIDMLSPQMLVVLGENKILTLDDLGDLATDELVDKKDGVLRQFELSEEEGNAVIMAARAHWFDDEDDPAPDSAASPEGAAGDDAAAGA
ncbi:MAG: transcription termination factor NusA [Pseudomonadota bacterium]